jgi:hypothetical protein
MTVLFIERKMIFDYRSSSCSHKGSIMNKSKVRVMVFKATFNNISVILWWSALLMEVCKNRFIKGPSWSMQSVPIITNVVSLNPAQARCTRYSIMGSSLAGWWFSLGILVSSIDDRHWLHRPRRPLNKSIFT